MVYTASIDAGFDGLKAIFGGLKGDKMYIPNVVYRMDRKESLGTGEGDPLQELHVKVTSDQLKESGVYAVGELASRNILADESSIQDRKGESDRTLIVLLTAIALDAVKNNNEDEINVEYLLSTGLPMDESKVEGSRTAFADKIKNGRHIVEFITTPRYAGKVVTISFKDVFVNTEGYAAMVNLTMDDDYKPMNVELLKKNVLIDDMGGNTTDFAVIRNGQIDSEYSTGIPLGIGPSLDDIMADVYTEHRFRFKTRRELVANIIADSDNYIIRPQGQVISIKPIVDKHFKILAEDHYNQLQRVWSKVGNIHSVEAVGGTAFMIKDFLNQINKDRYNFELNFSENAEESLWCIAKAYQKLLFLKAKKLGYELSDKATV